MKNLIRATLKALSLTIVMLSLTSSTLHAGGNDDTIAKTDSSSKKDHSTEYAEVLKELEEALMNAQQAEKIYESTPEVKIYDTDFQLIKEMKINEEGFVQDKEVLSLIRQSNIFMKSNNTTYYIVEN